LPPSSRISVAARGDSLTLRLGGEIDVQVMPQLRGTLAVLTRRAPTALCIDLTEDVFLCLSAMGALIVLRAGLLRNDVGISTPGATRTFLALIAYADRVGLPGQPAKPSV
jgi:anti-anti-sigma regulatory factor